jgi:PPM family protein phosphatase
MLTVCSKTDIGRKRNINQDTVCAWPAPHGSLPNLFVVADGMGGHKAGDYASSYAVSAIGREVEMDESSEPVMILKKAIECANEEIYEKAKEEEYSGMGTTVVASTIIGSTLFVANVGDSRLYIINDEIKQITKDHSLVEEMVRAGELNKEEARFHPDKNIITRAVGADRNVLIDFFEVDLSEGDVILMCSDGLSNMIGDDDINKIIKKHKNVEDMVDELVKVANHNGGRDNIGVVLVRFEGAN